jgi:hypothetical protein
VQAWHGHPARVSWAGRPCHEGVLQEPQFIVLINGHYDSRPIAVNDQITIVIKGRFEEGAFENLGKVRCCNFISAMTSAVVINYLFWLS